MENAAFIASGMTVAFQSSTDITYVLRDIDLRIAQSEFIAIVGRNGSGKSTLLKVMAGLCAVSRGDVYKQAWPAVQAVFQNPDAQMIGETVFEEICFGLENQGLPEEEMAKRAENALDKVGLARLKHQPVDKLSGGQKQLLCIAGALASDARLLVFDEPTSMLDPVSREQVISVVRQLHIEGRTIVWATQLIEELGWAQRVIVLDEGMIAYEGTPEHFFYGSGAAEEISPCEKGGFRKPYAVETAEQLMRTGITLPEKPVTLQQFKRVMDGLCRYS